MRLKTNTIHFLSVSIFHNNMPMFVGNLSRNFQLNSFNGNDLMVCLTGAGHI